MKRRAARQIGVLLALTLVAVACGGRVDDQAGGATASPVATATTKIAGGGKSDGGRAQKPGTNAKKGAKGTTKRGAATGSSTGALPQKIPTAVSAQVKAPKTANICGGKVIKTGSYVQFPWAPQCVPDFHGDNGGETYRGVYRDRIRVAVFIDRDPVVVSATRAAGGCGSSECAQDYNDAYIKWFEKYYQLYGRRIDPVYIEGQGSDSDESMQRDTARKVASIDPPVMASIGGPGAVYAEELAAKGIMCFCTTSLPQEFYQKYFPYVFSTLMSSTQAYIHRAEYIGKRLAGRKAKWAGDAATRARTRSFGLVWYDDSQGNYKSGVDFFIKQLARYHVKLQKVIRYENIEGCQIDATNIVNQLILARVTDVIFAGDPICPIHLTRAAENQNAKWEWIITGSALTDTTNFGRLYSQSQWSRAFGVSMLAPDVKNENDYWYKMYQEIRGRDQEPKEEAPVLLSWWINFFTGVHLAGPNLTPRTFAAGIAKDITTGGTVTIPQRSYGPKTVTGYRFWDTTAYDDMTEIWWDPNTKDPNGRDGTYWYVNGGHRYNWGEWPRTEPHVFSKRGAITGYDNPPDQ